MSSLASSLAASKWLAPLIIGIALIVISVVFGRIPLRYSLRNLKVRWLTTLLIAVAFTMVISLLTVMLAFVKGMYKLTEGSGNPKNVILLSAGVTDEAFSNLGFSETGDIENQPGVARDEQDRPLVSKETYVVVNQPVENPAPGGPRRRFMQLRGIEDPQIAAAVHSIDLHEGGEWWGQAGVQFLKSSEASDAAAAATTQSGNANAGEGGAERSSGDVGQTAGQTVVQAVLGEGVARELGRDPNSRDLPSVKKLGRLDAGDLIRVGGREWKIVGVMKSSGSTFDSEVWAKRSLVGQMFGKETYTSMIVRAKKVATAKKLRDFYNNEFKKAALQSQLETDYFAGLSKTNEQFLYAIGMIAAVMASGGAFGVTNTMLAAVAQRTKDIGVLRIIGYARWQVILCFLLESLFLSVLGGALGCLLGSFADGWSASSIVGSGQGGGKSVVLKLVVDADIILKCMTLSVAMGLIGGIYPAISTFRLRPLESLR